MTSLFIVADQDTATQILIEVSQEISPIVVGEDHSFDDTTVFADIFMTWSARNQSTFNDWFAAKIVPLTDLNTKVHIL